MGGCHCEDENPEMKKSTEGRVRQDLGEQFCHLVGTASALPNARQVFFWSNCPYSTFRKASECLNVCMFEAGCILSYPG